MSGKETRVYVGNLPPDIRSKDVEDLFYKYGKIVFIDLKNRKGPPFAFIEFEAARDAEDAVSGRDNYDYDGYKLRVEFPKGANAGGGYKGTRDFRPSSSNMNRNRGTGGGRRTDYRVLVSGLPPSGSWQDLKDHMRDAGEVCFTDVYKDGTGVCEFLRYEDMKYAIKKLDDTKFKSHEGETSYVRVKKDGGSSSRRSRSRSRSRSRTPKRTRGSPTYSPVKKSFSRSRSRSRGRY